MAARARRAPRPPRWLAPALAVWVIIAAAALGNSTTAPVKAEAVVALLGLLALAHGCVHRRWGVAGPLTTVAFITVGTAVAGWLPPGVQTAYDTGPAGSVAVRVIWLSAAVIATFDILWGLRLHTWLRAMAEGRDGAPVLDGSLAGAEVHQQLDELDSRIGAVEDLLTKVP